MPDSHDARLARALDSLEGLSMGDAFGVWQARTKGSKALLDETWKYTDDTLMALSIFSVLRQRGQIDQDNLAHSFAAVFVPHRGYGPGMRRLLPAIQRGGDWRELSRNLFPGSAARSGGEGSFGNGSAMRVAPVGAYFAGDMDALAREAAKSAEVTHCHPEGIAGAVAIAAAAGVAASLRGGPKLPRPEFVERALAVIPPSEVRQRVEWARDMPTGSTAKDAAKKLGNASKITCQETVAYAIFCAAEKLDNYEEALWMTISSCRDRDTMCAIVGGIVASYTGAADIPAEWLKRREPLPEWIFSDEQYRQ